MVKMIAAFILIFSLQAHAGIFVGVHSSSWQDAVPVSYTDTGTSQRVTFLSLTTFSSISVNAGYENLWSTRWRYAGEAAFHTGTADIHKIQGTVSPRKGFTSQWFSARVSYRLTKTFAIGLQGVLNSIQLKDAGSATSFGGLVHSDIEMSPDWRFIQTFGSMNDSGTIAYSIGLQKHF